ncbi:MAG: extracellular solute-binding protein [Treponema sp.]|jgi:multiple sugar transport system substrate-binding protein/putative aldouronate transport system substrate-binding protein|nr:extracellular solute-binding protein [Treponema sp.]
MEKIQKFVTAALIIALAVSTGVWAGGRRDDPSTAGGERALYRIEVFDTYANYMGTNSGWWGKILKDELNMELNIIAPQVAGTGDALYQTRTAAGNLGDLIVVSKARMVDLHQAGLLHDMKPLLDSGRYPDLQSKLRVAYEKFAEMFDGRGIYALPGRVSVKPPTDPAGRGVDPEQAIFLRFDWYLDIGAPEIDGLDGLMDVVEKMVKAHPTTETGEKTYGFSSFPDWDGNTVRLAREMLFCMGYTNASDYIWMSFDGSKLSYFMDDNGEYKKVLKFMNQAYRKGLLDPDSSTQNWDTHVAKYNNGGRIAMGYWTFQASTVFGRIDLTRRSPYAVIPVKGLVVNNVGYNPYGLEGNAYAIGSKARYPERIMEFMNWLCSPKGILTFNSQIEGVTYEMRNGQPYLTPFGLDTNPDKEAPASLGGGSWNEGIQRLNYPLTHQDDPNELLNGHSVNSNLWPSTIEINKNEWNVKWRELYKADNPLEMLKQRDLLVVTPGTDYTGPTTPTNITNIRAQLRSITQPAGWQMIYAKDDAEFERIWRDMKAQLDDFGYQEAIAFDLKNIQDRAATIRQTLSQFAR